MGRVFDIPERRVEAMMSIVDNAQVHKRYSIFPIDYTIEPRALSKTNNEYIEHAVKLGREAAEKCLSRADLKPEDIDLIITVSCTGFMIPSLDAHLIHQMGFRPNVRRMPFTELGCAAGAMALGRAADYLKAHPGDRKSTRLNSSHGYISYAVFCLKKKKLDLHHGLAAPRPDAVQHHSL